MKHLLSFSLRITSHPYFKHFLKEKISYFKFTTLNKNKFSGVVSWGSTPDGVEIFFEVETQ